MPPSAGATVNTADGYVATIGGGAGNIASGYATVGGGSANAASWDATVGGGDHNTAIEAYATVGGGGYNIASGYNATVGGGGHNIASDNYGTSVAEGGGYGGAGAATLYGKKQRSVLDGTLIFKANLLAYEDNNIAYGDGLPRGLVNGTNRNNAIEFINYTGSAVKARTVKNGVATETVYYIPGTYPENSVDAVRFYMIVATATEVKFYLDGVLIATHTTNIPTVPLNPYFGVVWVRHYVPLGIDYVSFEIIR
jgi:hypothetical protein